MTVNASQPVPASLSPRSGSGSGSTKDSGQVNSFDDILQGSKGRSTTTKMAAPKHASPDGAKQNYDQLANAANSEDVEETAHTSDRLKVVTKGINGDSTEMDADDGGNAKIRKPTPRADHVLAGHDLLPMLIKLSSISQKPAMNEQGKAASDMPDAASQQNKSAVLPDEDTRLPLTSLTSEEADSTSSTNLTDNLMKKIKGQDKADIQTAGSRRGQFGMVHASQHVLNSEGKVPNQQMDDLQPEKAMLDKVDENGKNAKNTNADRHASHTERVTIVAHQSFPAPAAQLPNQTSASLVNALASNIGSNQALVGNGAPPTSPLFVATATHMLKIELHPAELGVVNVNMRLSNSQLSIEIKPESHEAHRRLSSDTETITRSLRDLGFDVGKVTVLQPSVASTAAARPDAGGFTNASFGRDQQSFQSGNSGSQSDGSSGQQSGRNRNNDGENSRRDGAAIRTITRSDLFI